MTVADMVLDQHAEAARLDQRHIDGLLAAGVPPLALVKSWAGDWSPIHRARVHFRNDARFDFSRPGEEGCNAFTLVAFDADGEPADIVAFRDGAAAEWLGRSALVGGEQVNMVRFGDNAIDVWPSVVAWLAANRRGLVVLDPRRAFDALRQAEPLRVQSREQAKALRFALQGALPEIVVARMDIQMRQAEHVA